MKKFVSIALALAMVFTLAASAMASGNLYRDGNTWYFDAYEEGILWVKDNKYQYGYHVLAGQNNLGLQSSFTGKLVFVSFEPIEPKPKHDCDFKWGKYFESISYSLEKTSGNTNLCTFYLDKYNVYVCECGDVLYEPKTTIFPFSISNNFKGYIDLDGYTVYISISGNSKVNEFYYFPWAYDIEYDIWE